MQSRFICIVFFINLCHWPTDYGLSGVPLQQKQPYQSKGGGVITSHRPLERTRSEPPPYSHSLRHPLHVQYHLSQQYHKSGQDRFKKNTQLTKVRNGSRCQSHRVSMLCEVLPCFNHRKSVFNRKCNLIHIHLL